MSDLDAFARAYLRDAIVDDERLDPADPEVASWLDEQANELADWLRDTVENFTVAGMAAPPGDGS